MNENEEPKNSEVEDKTLPHPADTPMPDNTPANREAYKKFETPFPDPAKMKGPAPMCSGEFSFHDSVQMVLDVGGNFYKCPKCGRCVY